MAILVFCQSFGGSLFLALADTAFANSLGSALKTFAPTVHAETLLAAGATAIREVVPTESLHGVLLAYSQAISHVFYLAVGGASACFLFSWGMGWKNIKKAQESDTKV